MTYNFYQNDEAYKNELKNKKLFYENKVLIDQFFEIASRKVSILDEYGDENWDILPKEIDKLLLKIAKKNGLIVHKVRGVLYFPKEYEALKYNIETSFKDYYANKIKLPSRFENMSGLEFEVLSANFLKMLGFENVRGTKKTGDQGADLIANQNGKTIIFQAKCYSKPVGNKAVQEVIGALMYYKGDYGCVITNSTFTASAKELAQKSGIKLIDGLMFNEALTKIDKFKFNF
jgi:hypothetical protein